MRFSFLGKLKNLDMFTEPVQLNYDGGSTSYKSILGSIFSVTLFIAIIAYGL